MARNLKHGARQMRYMFGRSLIGLGLLGLVAAGSGGAGQLLAQTSKPGEPEVFAGGQRDLSSEFRLFGDRDLAFSGLRLAGDWGSAASNQSNIITGGQFYFNVAEPLFMPDWFDIFFYWAAPPSERDKHAAAVPSLANARGKGYTVNSGLSQFTGEILSEDGTLGPFHSGAATTTDGSCFDFTNDLWGAGNPLLAVNDCEPTWGSAGWQGSRIVDADGFLAYADLVGDANFSFDPWKVPEEFQRTDKFLGSFQTFGFFHDYSAETLFGSSVHPSYGNVIPASMGGDPAEDPTRSGWPMGLQAKIDAFSFSAPGMFATAWFQITVTNNSQLVYGVPLDYDSLYMGIQPGWLTQNQGTSNYRDPANGVVRGATSCQGFVDASSQGSSGNGCGPGGDPQHPADQWGAAPPTGVGAGFNYGAAAIIVMKSPIGDLRNKNFTDPASPFFGKGDPETWDDTITFNHGHMCGFHGCSAVLWNAPASTAANSDYEQRQFGMIASITDDVVGDRDRFSTSSITDHTLWDTWRYEEFPDRTQLDFNRWTPGGWDYDDDGTDDELVYDDCTDNAGPQLDPFTGLEKNCAVSWSDTLPGGFGNVYSNRGAIAGVGPISMPAGDTVQWIITLVHATDLAGIEADIATAIDHYNAFYLGPEAPPAPAITSVDIRQGGGNPGPDPTTQPEASITLYWDDTTADWEDPFLSKFLDDLLAADPGTELGRIRDLNSWLVDTLQARITDNVEFLYVFKSCDGGGGFTDDANCFDDPATGGTLGQVGWQPWQILEPDVDGKFPNSVSDNGIFGGRSFLYSLVAQTRGLSVSVQTGDVLDTVGVAPNDTVLCISGCGATTLDIAPPIIPAIPTSTSESSVVNVFVPITQQAGATMASIEEVTPSPDFVPFSRMNVIPTADDVADGQYALLFGDQVVATEVATISPAGAVTVDNVQVDVTDTGVGTVSFTADGAVAVDAPFTETIVGDQRTRVYTFSGLSAVLLNDNDRPITVTNQLGGGQSVTGRYFGLDNFPRFTFSVDNTVGGGFDQQLYLDAAGEPIRPLVEPAVTYLVSEAVTSAEGRYRVNWLDKAFGAGSPFTLDFADPTGTKSGFLASLEGRSSVQASTDPDIASFLGQPVEQLLAANLPFTIENITDEANPTPVSVVLLSSAKQTSMVLGQGRDTMIVAVPETEWLPGDELVLVEGSAPNFDITFSRAILGCDPSLWLRTSCNPLNVNTTGATGYIPNAEDNELLFSYFQTITSATEFEFAATSASTGRDIDLVSERDRILASLDSVKVVPNPYVMFSQYATGGGQDRIAFTHVPPRGVIRIYTVSGQFVQQLRWDPNDLNGRGDLFFNLRTREGNEMAAGLYLFVLTVKDRDGNEVGTARGKFVLIK